MFAATALKPHDEHVL